MKFDFDKVVDRRGEGSLKWDTGAADVLPMWVADMDFPTVPAVTEALEKRAAHGIFGYGKIMEGYYASAQAWLERRHHWKPELEAFTHCPGIVAGLHFVTRAFLKPGEKVLMQAPVYYPFFQAADRNHIEASSNMLLYKNGRYEIDFEDFETRAADPAVKVFFLCNPHNPGGRMWTAKELKRLGTICLKHGVMVVSDEIHSDLTLYGHTHVPFASICPEFANHSITFLAPSKTFNLAGLQASVVIAKNPEIRDRFIKEVTAAGISRPNVFALVGLEAAYRNGDEWLDQLKTYLEGNIAYFMERMKEVPGIRVMRPEAGYLIWFDFSGLRVDPRLFHQKLINAGKVWLDEGYLFGISGEGFERINVACPRSVMEEGTNRLIKTIKNM